MKPITPSEARQKKRADLPSFVIEVVNELIVENLTSDGSAVVRQEDIINRILGRSQGNITRQEIFNKRWLDFEEAFCDAGWQVEYDKPGYNETYPATFTFTPTRSAW